MLAERRVLVVDDEQTICAVVATVSKTGRAPSEYDGQAGLSVLRSAKFRLALIDVELPGLSGFDVAQARRER